MLDILMLNKSPFLNGKISGEYFKHHVNIDLNYIDEFLKSDKSLKEIIENNFNKLKVEYPRFFEETLGKAVGLEVDPLTYFALLSPEIMGIKRDKCTTIIAKNQNDNFVISHNEDDIFIPGNYALSKVYFESDNWFVTNDLYNMPFGNGFSWNSYGIIKTINYCYDEDIDINSLPRYFAQRLISEATSLEDLIEKCKSIPSASGYHVIAIDINKNEAVSIEVHKNKLDIEYITDKYIHTNHFIHNHCPAKAEKNSNSLNRLDIVRNMLNNTSISLENMQNILKYRSKDNNYMNSIFGTKNDYNMTLYNFSFEIDNIDTIYLTCFATDEVLSLKYDL